MSEEDRALLKRVEEKLDRLLEIATRGLEVEDVLEEMEPDPISAAFSKMHAESRRRRG